MASSNKVPPFAGLADTFEMLRKSGLPNMLLETVPGLLSSLAVDDRSSSLMDRGFGVRAGVVVADASVIIESDELFGELSGRMSLRGCAMGFQTFGGCTYARLLGSTGVFGVGRSSTLLTLVSCGRDVAMPYGV